MGLSIQELNMNRSIRLTDMNINKLLVNYLLLL